MTSPSPSLDGPVLVLAAMAQEAAPLTDRLEGATTLKTPFSGFFEATRGALAGTDTVVVTSGIGVAAAATAATWGILTTSPGVVVAAGSCGGLAADIEVGTLIVGDSFTYSIADATAFGYAPGQIPGGPERFSADPAWVDAVERAARGADERAADGRGTRRGLMLAGDAFVTAELAEPMRRRFPGALSADMETTATARTAEALGIPFVALRAVSDLCGPMDEQEEYHWDVEVAAEFSARAVEEFARSLAV